MCYVLDSSHSDRYIHFIVKLYINSAKNHFQIACAQLIHITLQTHHVDSTLKRHGNDHFHVVSTWNPRGVFVGNLSL